MLASNLAYHFTTHGTNSYSAKPINLNYLFNKKVNNVGSFP